MFAPHCSRCQSRVLLGPRRIVGFSWVDGARSVVLRCHCGQLVDGLAGAPVADGVGPQPEETSTRSATSLAVAG